MTCKYSARHVEHHNYAFSGFHKCLVLIDLEVLLANSETTEGMWSNWLALSAVADPVIVSFPDHPMRNLGVEACE